MTRVLIDTCVLVDLARGLDPAREYLDRLRSPPAVSALTVFEIHVGMRTAGQRPLFARLFRTWDVVPVDREIAERGGELYAQWHPSHGVGIADAIIAATAEVVGASVVSRNRRHFPMVSQLVVPY